jgi:MarR family transcriptional regulator, 2-MHQ and catechol-resistance regulon repressor
MESPTSFPFDIKIQYLKTLTAGQSAYVWRMPVKEIGQRRTDGTYVFQVLWKTYRTMHAIAEESKKKAGLGDSDYRVLEALFHQGPLPVNTIGEMISLTTGSITTCIDRMEAKWLVARKNHPDDRRIRLVELTAKGRRLIEKAHAQCSNDMEDAVSLLTKEDRAALIDLLQRLSTGNETLMMRAKRAAL